jgi:hypothetical protein
MLILKLDGEEFWDEGKQEFVYTEPIEVKLEHSLVSINKWESKWHVPFLGREHEKTPEEFVDYIRFMILSKNVNEDIIRRIITSESLMKQIHAYMDDSMTATKFSKKQQAAARVNQGGEFITAELIYYWMVALQIPFECEKWHINKLLTLIQVCNLKNTPPKKMSKQEIYAQNRALNAARRAKYHTKG